MQIQILTVTPSQKPSPKKPGTTYSALEVAFKNLTFQGKIEGKSLVGFGSNKPAYDALINAVPGEVYEITTVKENGYNTWTNATKGAAGASAAPTGASSGGSISRPSATTSPKSTYETPEERAKKQVYIVRQSSISNAIAVLSVGSKTRPDVKEVIDIASQLESYVFGNSYETVGGFTEADVAKPSDLDDDIPF